MLPLETADHDPHTGANKLNASGTSFNTTKRHSLRGSVAKVLMGITIINHPFGNGVYHY